MWNPWLHHLKPNMYVMYVLILYLYTWTLTFTYLYDYMHIFILRMFYIYTLYTVFFKIYSKHIHTCISYWGKTNWNFTFPKKSRNYFPRCLGSRCKCLGCFHGNKNGGSNSRLQICPRILHFRKQSATDGTYGCKYWVPLDRNLISCFLEQFSMSYRTSRD